MNVKVFKIRVSEEYLQQDESILNQFFAQYKIIKTATSFLNEKENYWSVLVFYSELDAQEKKESHFTKSSKLSVESETDLTDEEKIILKALKNWRFEKAQNLEIPAYMICTNTELMSVAKYKPLKAKDFFEIRGFGEHKVNKFATEILDVLMNV